MYDFYLLWRKNKGLKGPQQVTKMTTKTWESFFLLHKCLRSRQNKNNPFTNTHPHLTSRRAVFIWRNISVVRNSVRTEPKKTIVSPSRTDPKSYEPPTCPVSTSRWGVEVLYLGSPDFSRGFPFLVWGRILTVWFYPEVSSFWIEVFTSRILAQVTLLFN